MSKDAAHFKYSLNVCAPGKMGDSRKQNWEDPIGSVNVPLYNRMNFSTVPRKSANRKAW